MPSEDWFDRVFTKLSAHIEQSVDAMLAAADVRQVTGTTKTESGRTLREYSVKMPGGVRASLTLPRDLSETEIDALCNIIRQIGKSQTQ